MLRVLRERGVPRAYKEPLDGREHAIQDLQESEDLTSLFQISQPPRQISPNDVVDLSLRFSSCPPRPPFSLP